MSIVFDIETNALNLDDITVIHCIAVSHVNENHGNRKEVYSGKWLEKGIRQLELEDVIIGHNIIDYDIPVIKKFHPWFEPAMVVDTLVLARMFEPDRPEGHSLKSYAPMFGMAKVENENWDVNSQIIFDRCQSDVEINRQLYLYFKKTYMDTHDWKESMRIEHRIAKLMTAQARTGWLFDSKRAEGLVYRIEGEINEIDLKVYPYLKKTCRKVSEVKKPFKKDGSLSQQAMKYDRKYDWGCSCVDPSIKHCSGHRIYASGETCLSDISGQFSVIEFQPVNLSSEKQMKGLLLSLGWEPTQWNYKKGKDGKPLKVNNRLVKTSPKLTEDSYDSLPEGLGRDLRDRMVREHRLKLLRGKNAGDTKGLVNRVRLDGRLESRVNPCGTNTARMTHRVIANIPKKADNVFLGRELRELFICPEGRLLVGCDASGLEWRLAGHYINTQEVIYLIVSGDIHNRVMEVAGLPTRDMAKSCGFGILYGAGVGRVAQITGKKTQEAERIRTSIIEGLPGLKQLIDQVTHDSKRGYIETIDGRRIYTRSSHSALNALIQSAGSIIIKVAALIMDKYIKDHMYDCRQICVYHDEIVYECHKNIAEDIAELVKRAMLKSGEYFKLRIPIDSEAKIGLNWSEIH